MAVATIERPSWPCQPASAIGLEAALSGHADTWTYIAAAYFLLWTVVILLGL
jgi:hypothetical protein